MVSSDKLASVCRNGVYTEGMKLLAGAAEPDPSMHELGPLFCSETNWA